MLLRLGLSHSTHRVALLRPRVLSSLHSSVGESNGRSMVVSNSSGLVHRQYYSSWSRVSPISTTNDLFLNTLRKKGGKNAKPSKDAEEDEGAPQELDLEKPKVEMEAVVQELKEQLSIYKIGRADTQLLETIHVVQNKKSVPISSVAQLNVKDGSTLAVSVFDPKIQKDVSNAIRDADLDFEPTISGNLILVAIPKPTKKFKSKIIKKAAEQTEKARVQIRNIRRVTVDAMKQLKLPKDEAVALDKQIQKLHDEAIKKLETLLKQKEKEIESA